jgi:hypothetical protein
LKKFEVLKEFKDIHSQELYKLDSVHEVSDERFKEMTENLKQFDGEFIKEIKPKRKPRKKKAEDSTEEEGA